MIALRSILSGMLFCLFLNSTWAGYNSIQVFSKLNYYTSETEGQIVIRIDESLIDQKLRAKLFHEDELLGQVDQINSVITYMPFNLSNVSYGTHMFTCHISEKEEAAKHFYTEVVKRQPKNNEVKINLFTGGLIADGLPYFPFGFYCSSPVGDLAEQEAVRGFNLMAPYQRISPETLDERKSYMDRAAALGMKVHYALNSLVGSGHNNARIYGLSEEEKLELLKKEVETFRDHPALLAWYINDEPIGQGRPVELLVNAYNTVKELDPYHPASIVFMTPQRANEFEMAMDIAMTDPYPVPGDMGKVVEDVRHLKRHFGTRKSIWLVPQAFGGGEFWTREPTKQELRVMTYMGILEGVKGIQYFIRRGPNLFPKSIDTWSECSTMALDVAEMTPYLLSEEEPPEVSVDNEMIMANAWRYHGSILVVAVNKENHPKQLTIKLNTMELNGNARAIFEDRIVPVANGEIRDMITAYGTLVFIITGQEIPDRIQVSKSNLVLNPSFEHNPSVSIPAECYAGHASPDVHPGATYFIDNRLAVHGTHSLRLVTPSDSSGIRLSFYPVVLEEDNSYTISVWGKALQQEPMPTFIMGVSRMGISESFELTPDWKKYSTTFKVTENAGKPSVVLELITKGTGWFDLLEASPDPYIRYEITEEQIAEIEITSGLENPEIRYTLNGKIPARNAKKYSSAIFVNKPLTIRAGLFKDGRLFAESSGFIPVNAAFGKRVMFKESYSQRYSSKGDMSLTDGILGTTNFKDAQWLGFEGSDATMIIDLTKPTRINRAWANFLCDVNSGIHLPEEVIVEYSDDGTHFKKAGTFLNEEGSAEGPAYIKTFTVETGKIKARYIRLTARSIIRIPEGYLFKGTNAWTFIDEIMME